jgi:hypothetical protein
MPLIRTSTAMALAVAVMLAPTRAQCLQWADGYGAATIAGGAEPTVYSQTTYDDGSGPALFVGGSFAVAGSVVANNIAKWDGHHWSALGPGLDGAVRAMLVHQGALYVAGEFTHAGSVVVNRIARWDGSSWSPLGSGFDAPVRALAIFDDGSGAQLFAGGEFSSSGALSANRVARWNGNAWSSIYSGAALGGPTGVVNALAVFNGSLYAAGNLPDWGGAVINSIARWTGIGWAPLGQGLIGSLGGSASVLALCVWDDGGGPDLYAGGVIQYPAGQSTNYWWGVARWSGTTWSPLQSNVSLGTVFSLGPFGQKLYIGSPSSPGSGGAFTAWNGTSFSAPPEHVYYGPGDNGIVNSLWVHDDGSTAGPSLYISGYFEHVGQALAQSLARWNGSSWNVQFEQQVDKDVHGSVVWDDGSGPTQLLFGRFRQFGTGIDVGFARPLGASWQPFSGTSGGQPWPTFLTDSVVVNGTSGRTLYALSFASVWATQGTTWSIAGSTPSTLNCLASFDSGSGPELYVAGQFISFAGTWLPLSSGVTGGAIYDALEFDDGTGPSLYVAGNFTQAGGQSAHGIARWNGSSWSTLGSGASNGLNSYSVVALGVHDDGTGPALYAMGKFVQMSGVSANNIARWNGTSWGPVGSGLSAVIGFGAVYLASFDDGSGPALYVSGIPMQSGSFVSTCARWDGAAWQPVGPFDDSAYTVTRVEAVGSMPARLIFGGLFSVVAGTAAVRAAEWADHSCPLLAYCTAGVSSQGCVASISGSGAPSASASNGFTLQVTGAPGQKSGLLFYGVSGALASPWGSGYLCVRTPAQRTLTQMSGGSASACDGQLALDWNAFVATHPSCLGAPFSSGTPVWAQGWYRDPQSTKTTQLSNGLQFTVGP